MFSLSPGIISPLEILYFLHRENTTTKLPPGGYYLSGFERRTSRRIAKGTRDEPKATCQILGVAHNTLSQWESNSKDPSTAMLKRLCEILGCTSDYLIGLVDI